MNISKEQVVKALGERRMTKVSELCQEWDGFEIVLAEGVFYDGNTTLSYFAFPFYDELVEPEAKKKMLGDMKDFIDASE